MTFIAGDLAAVLRLEGKQKFDRDLASSGVQFNKLIGIGDKLGGVIKGGMQTAGVAFNVVTAAATALAVKVVSTGAAYNVLQQNSRVALKTLLGGSEAANAQMDKLDAFARNSPFSKSTFINAQQQLIGFGFSAKQVVPTLDAIQNAVAAIGGNNADIAEVSSILATIRSSASLGQNELDMLAGKGINAAQLIAAEMGVTEAEFRKSIFGNPLSGDDALQGLDALVSGMGKRFAGAAAGVKEQMQGAADRVKAATRDIGAAIAEPFVSKNGGGRAVVWANQVADVLRALEKHATPFTNFMVSRMAPAFETINNSLVTAKNLVNDFDTSKLANGFDKIAENGPALGVVLGVLGSFGTQIPVISQLGLSINPVVGGLIGIIAASPDVRDALGVLFTAVRPVTDEFGGLAQMLSGKLNVAVSVIADGIRSFAREGVPAIIDFASNLGDLAGYAPALAGLAAILLNYGKVGAVLGAVGITLGPVAAGIIGIVAASPELRGALADVLKAASPLIPVAEDLGKTLALVLGAALPLVAGGITTVANVATPLVRLLASIPAPVLVGAAAFLALHKSMGPLSAEGGKASNALTTITERAKAFGTTWSQQTVFVAGAGGEIQKMSGHAAALSPAFGMMKGAITGVGIALKTAFLSNPIGIALTVISTAVGIFTSVLAANEAKVQAQADKTANLRDTLNETSGAYTALTESAVRKNLEDAKMIENAEKIGVSFEDVVSAALGNEDAIARVEAATLRYNEANGKVAQGTTGAIQGAEKQTHAVMDLNDAIQSERDALDSAQDAQEAHRDALQRASAAMSDAERSNSRLNDAIAVARDTSKDATTRLNALKDALDELSGGSKTAAESQAELNEKTLDLAEGLAKTDENGVKLWQSMVDGAGALNTNTRAGLDFFHSLEDQNDGMLSAIQNAYDLAAANGDTEAATAAATAAGDNWIATLRTTMEQAGLTGPQIDALIGTYLDVPSVVATLLTDNGTIDAAKQKALELANQLLATPNKEIIVTEPMSPGIRARLIALGYQVKTLPDGTIQVSIPNQGTAEQILSNLARNRTAIITAQIKQTGADAGQVKAAYNENGNFYQRGIVQAFEDGGFARPDSGIYAGRPGGILMFAEPNVPWEAFISGKAGQEARNRRVLESAAQKLNMQVIPAGSQRRTAVTAFEDGGFVGTVPTQPRTGTDIQRIIDMLIAQSDAPVNFNGPVGSDPAEVVRLINRGRRRKRMMASFSRVAPA